MAMDTMDYNQVINNEGQIRKVKEDVEVSRNYAETEIAKDGLIL